MLSSEEIAYLKICYAVVAPRNERLDIMKPIQRSELATLILAAAILLGGYVRLNPSSLAGFAINDGGMFAVMVDDLRANGYALPAFTTYNHLDIPFAYPPLGFYLGALAADLSALRRCLPPVSERAVRVLSI